MGFEAIAVADAGPLIHLDELGGLETLFTTPALVEAALRILRG